MIFPVRKTSSLLHRASGLISFANPEALLIYSADINTGINFFSQKKRGAANVRVTP